MKKLIVLIGFVVMMQTSLWALGGFGLYYLQDGYTIEETENNWSVDSDIAFTKIEGVKSPMGFGGYIYFDLLRFFYLEGGYEISGITNYYYGFNNDQEKFKIPQRAGMYLGLQKPFDLPIPMTKFYLGLGYSANVIVPELNQDFIESHADEFNNDYEDSNAIIEVIKDNLIKQNGYYCEFGGRIKPWLIPLSVNAKLRYHFIEDVVPGTDSYLSFMIGLGFAL